MTDDTYQVIQPKVALGRYIPIGLLLGASLLTPVLAWLIWRDANIFARAGSLSVFFAATAEFITLNRANRKHILNACRARKHEVPWDFSKPDKVVGIIALILALAGTIIWGFGDLLVGR
jgi:hypothetical protein